VDVEPATWCIDPEAAEAAITPRTKGIIPVDLYGHPADLDAINEVAARHNLWVVEDAAEAVFAKYKGRPVGGLAQITTFSFHVTKVLTSGEGGAITLDDETKEKFIRMICSHGMDPTRRFFFPVVGYNYRLTNTAAALLCAQIERHEQFLQRRSEIFALYRELLRDTPGISFRPVAQWATLSPWLFSILVDPKEFGHSRDDVMAALEAENIESRPFFIPVHALPAFAEATRQRGAELAITQRLCGRGINLPTSTVMSDGEVERVASVIAGMSKSSR
jgi:perosamine synthetase